MSEVHYFPRYSQPENVVTNNTLLLLLRLREYNRFKFEKFMEATCADQEVQLASSWLQFRQQKGTGKSVVDGFIAQDSIKIAVETKLTDSIPFSLRTTWRCSGRNSISSLSCSVRHLEQSPPGNWLWFDSTRYHEIFRLFIRLLRRL
jgi:hypothetical protein